MKYNNIMKRRTNFWYNIYISVVILLVILTGLILYKSCSDIKNGNTTTITACWTEWIIKSGSVTNDYMVALTNIPPMKYIVYPTPKYTNIESKKLATLLMEH
jgi:hypothetical protein